MQKYFLVAFGAAIGGTLRYWMAGVVQKIFSSTFPFGTLSVNILGSFILGFIIFFLDSGELISSEMRIFLTVGFCGGFTTFSTFSFETINLLRNTEYFYAFLNANTNLFLTLAAVVLAIIYQKL